MQIRWKLTSVFAKEKSFPLRSSGFIVLLFWIKSVTITVSIWAETEKKKWKLFRPVRGLKQPEPDETAVLESKPDQKMTSPYSDWLIPVEACARNAYSASGRYRKLTTRR